MYPASFLKDCLLHKNVYLCSMKRWLFLFLFFTLTIHLFSQETYIFTDDIKTLRITVDGQEQRFPILQMGKGEQLNISFDDLTHDYRRYSYRIEHCTYDFKTSTQLFESEYLTSPSNEEVITNYQQSFNTAILYTHYSFSFPNASMQPLLSGNYRLSILRTSEAGEPERVAETYFAIVEPLALVSAIVSANTEVDYRDSHQQVSLNVDASNLQGLDYPQEEIKTYVLQNRRWDNVAQNPPYTSQMGNRFLWEHSKDLIFDAGNEYRKFEMLSTRHATMHIDRLYMLDGIYNAEVMTDKPRNHYLYDEDQNGRFVVRSDDRSNDDIEADYFLTHFTLQMPKLKGKRIFLNGRWTGRSLNPDYELRYNEDTQAYEASVLLKQGYYSYQYLTAPNSTEKANTNETEGNFFQTENEYTVLIYFHNQSERYDRLVGFSQVYSSIQ